MENILAACTLMILGCLFSSCAHDKAFRDLQPGQREVVFYYDIGKKRNHLGGMVVDYLDLETLATGTHYKTSPKSNNFRSDFVVLYHSGGKTGLMGGAIKRKPMTTQSFKVETKDAWMTGGGDIRDQIMVPAGLETVYVRYTNHATHHYTVKDKMVYVNNIPLNQKVIDYQTRDQLDIRVHLVCNILSWSDLRFLLSILT